MNFNFINSVYGPQSNKLSCKKLSELCVAGGVQTGPFGSQLHQKDYVDAGTPIITVEHLGENQIVHKNLPRVSQKDRERLAKYSLKSGDIVFSRVGSVDRRALVKQSEDGWLFSGRCLRVRPNPEILDGRWLSYFFGLPAFKSYIRGIAVGATMPSLNTDILSNVPIFFPDLKTQKAIGKILAEIDQQITLLNQTNSTLEAIAQACFKSWFVDFEPVMANREKRGPIGIDNATAELFPDSFEQCEGVEIPQGWQVISASEKFNFERGCEPGRKNYYENDIENTCQFIRVGDLSKQTSNIFVPSTFYPKNGVKETDILLTTDGTAGLVGYGFNGVISSGIRKVTYKDKSSGFYIYNYLKSRDFQEELFKNTPPHTTIIHAGSGIANIKLICPSHKIIAKYDELFDPVFKKILINNLNINLYSQIRDNLLPRLFSGKLDLTNFESLIEVTA